MPICPRCGKILSTNQALEYHLSKQKKCSTKLNCFTCGYLCSTNLEMKIHKSHCDSSFHHLVSLLGRNTFDDIVLVDSRFKVYYSSISGLNINDNLLKLIHQNLGHNVSSWIQNPNIPHFTKTNNNVPIYITFTEYSNFYIAFIRKFKHKYKLPGFLTPDL